MSKKIIKTNAAPQAIGPYSQAVEAGGFVYVSGQIPIDPKTGNLMQSDIGSQATCILENARSILAEAGCDMTCVVKATLYLKNMDDFSVVNDVYGKYFPSNPPARATVEVSRLPKDVSLEMDFIAWKG